MKAPTWMLLLPRTAWILAVVQFGCGGESSIAPQVKRVLRIEPASRVTLVGIVATDVTPAPTVLVIDQDRRPVVGVEVAFFTSSLHGTPAEMSTLTGMDGRATIGVWRLGTKAGTQTLTAATRANPSVRVVFSAAASPGAATTLISLDSTERVPTGGTISPRVRVADAFGNPVADAPVSFKVESGGGELVDSIAATDVAGVARTDWRVGDVGQNSVNASIPTGYVRFTTMVFEALAYYELEPIPTFSTPPATWIALEPGGRFTTSVSGLRGHGEFTDAGPNSVLLYSDEFLGLLGGTMGWWTYPYSLTQEVASITPEAIVLRRCWSEDCYEVNWTYRRKHR